MIQIVTERIAYAAINREEIVEFYQLNLPLRVFTPISNLLIMPEELLMPWNDGFFITSFMYGNVCYTHFKPFISKS
jgi:hypothetical protein